MPRGRAVAGRLSGSIAAWSSRNASFCEFAAARAATQTMQQGEPAGTGGGKVNQKMCFLNAYQLGIAGWWEADWLLGLLEHRPVVWKEPLKGRCPSAPHELHNMAQDSCVESELGGGQGPQGALSRGARVGTAMVASALGNRAPQRPSICNIPSLASTQARL